MGETFLKTPDGGLHEPAFAARAETTASARPGKRNAAAAGLRAEISRGSATKGAIVAFTRSLSEALVEKGIRVNAVAPGPIWTPLIPASFEPDHVAKHGASTPMKRAGQPNEVAPCYVFLANEEASYLSGKILHPNGGKVVGC